MKYYPTFGHLFDDFFNDSSYAPQSGALKADIYEKDDAYHVSMEVPGYKKEDIQIALENGYLKITASKNQENEETDDKGKLIRRERITGTVSRSFYVGHNYKEEDIQATFDNGELTITLPTEAKKIEETKKIIQIQ